MTGTGKATLKIGDYTYDVFITEMKIDHDFTSNDMWGWGGDKVTVHRDLEQTMQVTARVGSVTRDEPEEQTACEEVPDYITAKSMPEGKVVKTTADVGTIENATLLATSISDSSVIMPKYNLEAVEAFKKAAEEAAIKVKELNAKESEPEMCYDRDCREDCNMKSTSEYQPLVERVRDAELSDSDKLLRKYGVLNRAGNLTESGKELLLDMLFDENEAAIVERLELIDQKEKK